MSTSDDRLRQLQRSLGERDDQLRLALETVGLGTWEWTPSSGEFICSPCGRALQGLAADVPLNFEAFMSCVHPEDRDALIGAMHDALHDGADFCCEYRAVGADGDTRRLNGLGRVIYTGTQGSALRIAGVLQEIGAPDGLDATADGSGQATLSGVAKLDRDLRFVSANPRFVATLQLADRPLAGRRLNEVLPGLPPQWRDAAASCLEGAAIQATAESFAPWDRAGERIGGSFYAWYDDRNKPGGVLLVLEASNNIVTAESTQATEAPPEFELPWSLSPQLRNLAESAALPIVALDDTGAIRYMNAAWRQLTGLPAERALHSDWLATVHAADRSQVATALRSGPITLAEPLKFRLTRAGGESDWMECHILTLHDDFGGVQGHLILAADASGRVKEPGSATQRQQQLRMFARHLQRMRELERLELAASLQQDFQEELSRFNATLLTLTRDPALTGAVREPLQQLARQTQHLRDQLREMVLELAPPGIEELGFTGALRRLIDELRERSGLQISLQAPESLERIGNKAQAALYHAAREALGNAVEHANASRIDVSVESRPDQVRLRISDNGIGVSDRARNRPGRFGLFAAAEKLAQVHGALRVFGVPGNGTVVEASVSLARGWRSKQGGGGS